MDSVHSLALATRNGWLGYGEWESHPTDYYSLGFKNKRKCCGGVGSVLVPMHLLPHNWEEILKCVSLPVNVIGAYLLGSGDNGVAVFHVTDPVFQRATEDQYKYNRDAWLKIVLGKVWNSIYATDEFVTFWSARKDCIKAYTLQCHDACIHFNDGHWRKLEVNATGDALLNGIETYSEFMGKIESYIKNEKQRV